jgi:hypothetical protein
MCIISQTINGIPFIPRPPAHLRSQQYTGIFATVQAPDPLYEGKRLTASNNAELLPRNWSHIHEYMLTVHG